MKKSINHTFLLENYNKVNEYLSEKNTQKYSFQDIVVSFCVVVEKILKIKLHKRNPILVFEMDKIKDKDCLIMVVAKRENNVRTAKFEEIIKRFGLIFRKNFTETDEQALCDIYQVRNNLIHGYKTDDDFLYDKEDLMKKMGVMWLKISDIALKLFGKEMIKKSIPKKKYSQKELEAVLESEVAEMIKRPGDGNGLPTTVSIYDPISDFTSGEECPRCGLYAFLKDDNNDWFIGGIADSTITSFSQKTKSNLYKCRKCHLELTERQYKIAKKIKL